MERKFKEKRERLTGLVIILTVLSLRDSVGVNNVSLRLIMRNHLLQFLKVDMRLQSRCATCKCRQLYRRL